METMQGLQNTKIALLIDFDNVILGVEDPGFDVELVVNTLRSRGVVVMGRAYGDWYRHHRHRRKLMEQGIELVETPVFGPLIKNSADIRIVIDGLDIAAAHSHIDTFCLVSGDSDFLPLIKRLQLLGKHVIVIAGIKFTSDLVRRNCNEYLAYENLLAESVGATEDASTLEGSFVLLARAIDTLNERGMDIRSSSVKQMMLQLNPAFSERTFGCYQFKQFLDKAARAGVIQVNERVGNSGEHDVLLTEKNSRDIKPTISSTGNSVANGTTNSSNETAARDLNGATSKRDSSRGGRGRNRFGDKTETAVASAELTTAKTDALSDAAEVPNGAPVAPISTGALTSRPGLRRGRLRFSAKSGGTSIAPETAPETASEVVAPETSSTRSDEETTEAAPIEMALDVVQTPQDVLPAESVFAETVGKAEAVAETDDVPVAEYSVATETTDELPSATKRRGSRGGRRRRGAKNGEVAPESDATETAATETAATETAATENVAAEKSVTKTPEFETVMAAETSELSIPSAKTEDVSESVSPESSLEVASSELAAPEKAAPKKRAPRRRSPKKVTVAETASAEPTADVVEGA